MYQSVLPSPIAKCDERTCFCDGGLLLITSGHSNWRNEFAGACIGAVGTVICCFSEALCRRQPNGSWVLFLRHVCLGQAAVLGAQFFLVAFGC